MLKIFQKIWPLVILFSVIFFLPKATFASQPHYTLIINQIRGTGCCDPGNLKYLENQINALEKNNLTGVFAVRYDALIDPSFSDLLNKAKERNEMAAFLEITPDLASKSGVAYRATAQNWYEATHAYLLGYSQDDREKLIDSYMQEFKSFFGYYPATSVAWMVDAYSLQYLHDVYGVNVHEITREQWDTDSTSLLGGPPHYPYFPSKNWALIPSNVSTMPLIIRQTITDPIENYGDFTNSHTSQPNDYMPRDPSFSYFEHLFAQAHNQPQNPYTFALVGLENSMAEIYQDTFLKQLEYIGKWKSDSNSVLTAKDFYSKFNLPTQPVIYSGKGAWWITTNSYRVRVRQINNTVFISDIRIYNPDFKDPYFERVASDGAYWVVPFLLDGSRFFKNQTWETVLKPVPDSLDSDKILIPDITNLNPELKNNDIVFGDKLIFNNDWFEIPQNSVFGNLEWPNLIKLDIKKSGNLLRLTPWSINNLETERQNKYQLLLPHLSTSGLDFTKSYLYANNLYSISDRNPVRLIFYPKDKDGYPAATSKPTLTTFPNISNINIGTPDRLSGAIFFDFLAEKGGKYEINININGTIFRRTVYFTANCKNDFKSCLKNPIYFWWYLKTFF